MLACNCLNVIVESEKGDFQKVTDYTKYKFTKEEHQDKFFKEEHYNCTVIPQITVQQILLQDVSEIGDWNIFRCINCDIAAYAVHKYKGSSWTLFPTYLMTFQKIKELRSSKHFSRCFKLVLPEKVEKSKLKQVHPYILAELKCHEGNFIKQFHQFKDKEKKACEERILEFAQMQHSLIEDLLEMEENFLEALKWKIIEDKQKRFTEDKASLAKIQVSPLNRNLTEDESKDPFSSSDRKEWEAEGNIDSSEEVFEMEDVDGIEDSPHSHLHSQFEDDSDEDKLNDNAIDVPRQRANSSSIAKSLPINIPAFLTAAPRNQPEDETENLTEEEDGKVDIAASIKALARSVHGEAVFGELPRPRFSSQM